MGAVMIGRIGNVAFLKKGGGCQCKQVDPNINEKEKLKSSLTMMKLPCNNGGIVLKEGTCKYHVKEGERAKGEMGQSEWVPTAGALSCPIVVKFFKGATNHRFNWQLAPNEHL